MATSLKYIPEPMLQFGRDQHPDIRYGIMNFGPYDLSEKRRPSSIKVAVVGTAPDLANAARWIELCRNKILGHPSPKRNLFAPFPGFSNESPFQCECVLDASLNSEVRGEKITELATLPKFNDRVTAAVDIFLERIANTVTKKPDVVVVVMPLELLALLGEESAIAGPDAEGHEPVPLPARARRRGRFNF